MHPSSVPSAALRCPILCARGAGVDVDERLAPYELSVASFEVRAPSFDLPLPRVVDVLQTLLAIEDPAWALRGASALPPGAMGILDHLCAAAPTVEQSIADFARYFGMVAHGASMTLEPGEDLVLELAFDGVSGPMGWMFIESTFGLMWSRLRSNLGRPEIRPSVIELECPADADVLDAWTRALGIAPSTGRSRNRLGVPGSLVGESLLRSDGALRAFLTGLAGDSLPAESPARAPTPSWASRVAAHLREGQRDVELAAVARMLAVSERTLRRRLAEEDTSFSEIRQRELQRRAQVLLESGHLSTAEVAFTLGFSEMSAFNRAFKRWTGTTPGRWRGQR